MALPVAQPGALDDDEIYEFAAADLLADLQRRATRRGWSMRVEVEVEQTAVDASGLRPVRAGARRKRRRCSCCAHADAPGGGRRLTFGTGLHTRPRRWSAWPGAYVVQHAATPPTAIDPALACTFELGLTEYEFEA